MPNLDVISQQELDKLKNSNLLRTLSETSRYSDSVIIRNGKKLVSFCCNDYLGLSQNKIVRQAALDATKKYGIGSGASRLVTGNNPLYQQLEQKLAAYKGTSGAVVFGSGYLANVGIIPALVGRNDLIIADKLVHACLIDGAKLSGAKMLRYQHNDLESCNNLLQKNRDKYENCLVITDTVFSMDGDKAPIEELLSIASKYDSWLLSDDAHGLGVMENKKIVNPNYLQMGTLSKAMGSYGGYLCASAKIIEYIKNKARSLIYSTALPPMVIAASIAALEIIEEDVKLVAKPLANAKLFTELLGIKEAESSIVALIIGDEKEAMDASKRLEEEGFLVSAIRPPTVPEGTARLRVTFSALHQRKDIERLAEWVRANIKIKEKK